MASIDAIDDLIPVLQFIISEPTTSEKHVDIHSWSAELTENHPLRNDPLWGFSMGIQCPPLFARMLLILRECLLAHRWDEAARVFSAVAMTPSSTCRPLQDVGLDLFFGHEELLPQFTKLLKQISDLDYGEVKLQEAMWKLSGGHLEEATHILKDRKAYGGKGHPSKVTKLCKYYEGLILYTEWLSNRVDRDTIIEEGTILDSNAQKACDLWSGVEKVDGVWDIFITKYVEVLEYYGLQREALEILETYSEKHPDNPNSLRYLYQFYSRNQYNVQTCMKPLQEYCKAVPSDGLTLKLHEMMKSAGKLPNERLHLLFDLLDYQCWQHNGKAWMTLADELIISHSSSNLMEKQADYMRQAAKSCFESRFTWWPQYHFRHDQVSSDVLTHNDPPDRAVESSKRKCFQLVVCKAAVAKCLFGPENAYFQGVLQLDNLSLEEKIYLDGARYIWEPC